MNTLPIRQFLHFIRSRYVFNNLPYSSNFEIKDKIDYKFTFLIGTSGSGTTVLSRILCSPRPVIGIDDFKDVPVSDGSARKFVHRFKITTEILWDKTSSTHDYRRAKSALPQIVNDLIRHKFYKDASHIVHKRSSPFFWGDRFRPDMSDLFDVFKDPKIIVIYRDPSESTYSSLRRGFGLHVKHLAVICENQLTYINSQVSQLRKDTYKIITYEDLCTRPIETIEELAKFSGLPFDELEKATTREQLTQSKMGRWRQSLPIDDVIFLDAFFNDRRKSQWNVLCNSGKQG